MTNRTGLTAKLLKGDNLDYLYGLIALGLVAGFGLLTNFGIAYLFDAATLGLFGLGIAVYIICTQLVVFGVQNSSLHYCAIEEPQELDKVVGGALAVVCATSVAVLFCALGLLAIFQAHIPPQRLAVVSIAILSSPSGALLKTLLFCLNGMRRIGQFYFLQVSRVVLVAVWVLVVYLFEIEGTWIVACFLFAETIVGLVAFGFLRLANGISPSLDGAWIMKHFSFGRRAFTSGLSSETHTRVDLFVLSFFVDDLKLGIYTFVTMLWDGLYQYLSIVRNITNPKIAKLYAQGQLRDLVATLNRAKLTAFAGYALGTIVILAAYHLIIDVLALDAALKMGWSALAILLIVTCCASWLLPFDQALSQCGAPVANSITLASGALTNLILNLALIPFLGIIGAAIATGISWLVLAIYLVIACRRVIGVDLVFGRKSP